MSRQLDVTGLSQAYRSLVLCFGAQLLVNFGGRALIAGTEGGAGQLVIASMVLVVGLVTVAAIVYYAYKTAEALGSDKAVLWAIGMLIPCVNILTLLALSSTATKVCRENGVPVGFLGPKI